MSGARGTQFAAALGHAALIVIGTAPLWVHALRDAPGFGLLARTLDAWFQFHCQRDAHRSLWWLGRQLPVCMRCFGIYSGLWLGALILRPAMSSALTLTWVLLAAAIMLLDVATEFLDMRPACGALRSATGILLSYPVGVTLGRALLRTTRRVQSRTST